MQTLLTRLQTAAAGFAASALLASAALAAPTVVSNSGNTAVTFSPQLVSAAASLHVTIGGIAPAAFNASGAAVFPFLDGAIDAANAEGEIIHGGGLSLAGGSTKVTLTDFIIDTTGSQPVLTGLATLNGSVVGRLPLFNLALPGLALPLAPDASGKIVVRNVVVALTAQAASALNSAFNVTAFSQGQSVGTAKVRAKMLTVLK